MKILAVFILLSITTVCVNSYKILYLFPWASKSHRYVFDPVIEELTRRKHSVTIISPFKSPKPQENIQEIVVKNPFDDKSQFTRSILDSFGTNPLLGFYFFKDLRSSICDVYLNNAEVKELLKQGQQFDVAIVCAILNDCALGTAQLLSKHIMVHSPSNYPAWMTHIVPQPPSYIPYNLVSHGSKMGFFERMNNAFTWAGVQFISDHIHIPAIQQVIAKHLPENPSIKEALNKVAFTLTNADPVITSPRPSYPTIANVGGTHVKKAKALPNEFEDFIQSGGAEGFILFCLGSNVQSKDIPEEMRKGMLAAFSKLKLNVIWKYEEKIDDLPKNVMVTKWLPQQDLLGHPKIRLFITHGGMLSLQESVFNGVPMVAVPFFAEQPGNVARIEEIGIAVKLDFPTISEKTMSEAVTKVLNDKSYAENAKKYSAIFHEHVKGKLEEAANWIEYVIRFDGAPHFRSAGEQLNFFQYFLLDVAAFVISILGVIGLVLLQLGKVFCNKFCKCKKTVVSSKKNQ